MHSVLVHGQEYKVCEQVLWKCKKYKKKTLPIAFKKWRNKCGLHIIKIRQQESGWAINLAIPTSKKLGKAKRREKFSRWMLNLYKFRGRKREQSKRRNRQYANFIIDVKRFLAAKCLSSVKWYRPGQANS